MTENRHYAAVAFALILAGFAHPGAAQEMISGGTSKTWETPGGPVVLEMGGSEPAPEYGTAPAPAQDPAVETAPANPVRYSGPGVEMIVGGQGSEGIARKGTLPVVD